MTEDFTFLDPGKLVDDDLELILVRKIPADPVKQYVPWYAFEMRSVPDGVVMGNLRFRVGDAETALGYCGHVGYDVDEGFRGHRYAARSVRLLLPLARAHGLTKLWLSCRPENAASQRSCEIAGATLSDTVDIPEGHEMYQKGIRAMCRYWIDLERECRTGSNATS